MKKILCSVVLLFAFAGMAQAVTINFDNTEVPGISNSDLVTNQWNSFGLGISNAYWYSDSRDTFDQMGLSVAPVGATNIARVDLLGGVTTNSMDVQWWAITGTIYIDVYDAADNLLDSFSNGVGIGTTTLTGTGISYLTWREAGGFVQISGLSYDVAAIPEPSTILLFGFGLLLLGAFGRRRIKG